MLVGPPFESEMNFTTGLSRHEKKKTVKEGWYKTDRSGGGAKLF